MGQLLHWQDCLVMPKGASTASMVDWLPRVQFMISQVCPNALVNAIALTQT